MRGKPLSDDLVHAIYMKRDRGLSLRAIANTLEISLGAVQNVLKRRVPNQLEQKKAKLGPRRITNAITDAKIVLAMKRRRFQSNSKLANDFGVSRETFRRRGKEAKTYNVSSFLTGVCTLCAALYGTLVVFFHFHVDFYMSMASLTGGLQKSFVSRIISKKEPLL
jgi:DNA-binding Lrp family transcriptional regulator